VPAGIVVVGAGIGGLRVAEAVRAAGFPGDVTVIGAEPHMPYNRPPLSKEALAGGATHERLAFRLRRAVADVRWLLGRTATAASLAERTVRLDGGEVLGYAGLAVTTGLRVRRLDLPGPRVGRHALRTLEDAARLREDLRPGRRLVIAGAGFLGCEVAATAAGVGCEVTVVAPEREPMQRPLGVTVGAAMRRRHEARGVQFRLGRVPVALDADPGSDRLAAVLLDDDTRLPADVLVEAVGAVPDVGWLEGNGLDLGDGLLCDGWMRVQGRADVVAAGDVARFTDPRFAPQPRRLEHWSNPTDTGRLAGRALAAALAGEQLPQPPALPLPQFFSDQFDIHLQSFGALEGGDEVRVLEGDLDDGEFLISYLLAGRLRGVLGNGLMPRVLALREQIAGSTMID
jgi:3-phenylpropionate/trans-cinnamate dioxygenase ferredoxin reductase subunit